MKMNKEIKDMLSSDESNKLSSKRVITFAGFTLLAIGFIANLIWGIIIDPNILNGMLTIVLAGLGVVVGEHLFNKRNGNNHYGSGNNHYGSGNNQYDSNDPYDVNDPYGSGNSYDSEFPDGNEEILGDN